MKDVEALYWRTVRGLGRAKAKRKIAAQEAQASSVRLNDVGFAICVLLGMPQRLARKLPTSIRKTQ